MQCLFLGSFKYALARTEPDVGDIRERRCVGSCANWYRYLGDDGILCIPTLRKIGNRDVCGWEISAPRKQGQGQTVCGNRTTAHHLTGYHANMLTSTGAGVACPWPTQARMLGNVSRLLEGELLEVWGDVGATSALQPRQSPWRISSAATGGNE